MGILLAEGWDAYAAVADMVSVGWIANGAVSDNSTPFSQGQAYHTTTTINPYSWGSNEATVYGSIYVKTNAVSSSSSYVYLSLRDGTTSQVTMRWNTDGSVGLYSGGPTGTLISTTSSVFTGGLSGAWTSFQFKIVIDNTVGSIEIRVNGSPTNTITQTGINTRGGTANAYVNAVGLGATALTFVVDNLFLTTTGWTGEMRALQQYPTSVVTPNFSLFPTTTTSPAGNSAFTISTTNGNSYYCQFAAPATGTITSIAFSCNAGTTANVKMSIFDTTGPNGPGAVLASANVVSNPTTGANTFTFSTPLAVTNGTLYWLGWSNDATVVWKTSNTTTAFSSGLSRNTTAYASFPAANPASFTFQGNYPAAAITVVNEQSVGVYDLIQDGDTSYIYTSSNVEDKYNLSQIATTYSVTAVQYFAMHKKTDAGYRSLALSVDIGAGDTNIITVTPTLSYAYTIKTMDLDPAGASWTPTKVNNALLGITAGS